MDETRRFLRFVIPGTLFAIEVVVLLLLLRPDWFLSKSETLDGRDVLAINDAVSLGSVLGALLASGALGYLFSVIYHALHWTPQCSAFDYSPIITGLIRGRKIQVNVLDPRDGTTQRELGPEAVTREIALTVLSTLWYASLCDKESSIKDADAKADRLSDLTHSAGIACVASFFALSAALLVAACFSQISCDPKAIARFALACVLGTILIRVFWKTYRRVGRMAQSVIEQVLLQHLYANEGNGNEDATARQVYICETSMPHEAGVFQDGGKVADVESDERDKL